MSLNKRRWSNEFMDSLIDFQSKDSNSINKTFLFDSLESKKIEISIDSLDNKSKDVPFILTLKSDFVALGNLQEVVKKNYTSNLSINDSDNEGRKNSSSNILNFKMTEDCNISSNDLNSKLAIDDILNINTNVLEKDILDTNECLNKAPNQINNLFNLNENSRENIILNNEIIKESCFDLNLQTKTEIQSTKSQCTENSKAIFRGLDQPDHVLNKNEKAMKNISLNTRTLKLFSCNSNNQNSVKITSIKHQIYQSPKESSIKGQINQKFFSSPLEFSPSNHEMIAEMNKPDIWDALLALEQALSPVEVRAQNVDECFEEHPHILSRLSQKFKKTPTRFTEKLVSIIEDSIMSSESPTKHYSGDNSGISLHRMTGEFRKLCKFIEDESMPEWAPSLTNMTGSCIESTQTPEYEIKSKNFNETPKNMLRLIKDSPTLRIIPKTFQYHQSPKNKIISNINSPVNRFTPTADKSFEYWETVCNMMCNNNANTKKNTRNNLCMPDSSKSRMYEMLTICERQLASLDDSTIDIRSSEPCKKTDSNIKSKIDQVPRSKSESKIVLNTNENRKQTPNEHKNEKIKKSVIFVNDCELSNEIDNLKINNASAFKNYSKSQSNINLEQHVSKAQEDFEFSANNDSNQSDQEIFDKDFEFLTDSPKKKQGEIMEDPYNYNEQDCSLLIELAKRRQRCLDTAKLMMEIDKNDPITNEDSKCLETLYKLGIQNKTFAEVEEDTKFLNTLSQCIEYKNYISNKSKPLLNMLNEFDSPDDLKNKATSAIRSKKILNQPNVSDYKTKSHQKPTLAKSHAESKNSLKNVHDKKITSRLIEKSNSKAVPQVEKKSSQLLDSRKKKETQRVDKATLYLPSLQKMKATSREISKTSNKMIPVMDKDNSPQIEIPRKNTIQTIITKPLLKVSQSDQRFQSKKLIPKVASNVRPKITSQLNQQKISLKLSPAKYTHFKIDPKVNEIEDRNNEFPLLRDCDQNAIPLAPKLRLFLTPGKSPRTTTLGRKKPQSYFSDATYKKSSTPLKTDYENVKSPISLYIHGTDTDLIQNVHGRINDRLLTPISNKNSGNSPRLKFALSSKENKSPTDNCNENIILPTVRYQSAKKVHLIDDKSSYSPSSLTPNSKTKILLGPIENTVVIRHAGRVLDYSPQQSEFIHSETSIRVQKMAEKTMSTRKKMYIM